MKTFKQLIAITITAFFILGSFSPAWAYDRAKEDAQWAELKDNCKELGVPAPPEIHINFEVKDKDGNVIFVDRQRGHSWTRNFYNYLFGICTGSYKSGTTFEAGALTGKRTNATIESITNYSCGNNNNQNAGLISNAAANTWGIVVGTDATAFSAEHHSLQTVVASGNSAGQLAYSTMVGQPSVYDPSAGAEKWTGHLVRVFNNNSGGSIVLAEVGIYFYGGLYTNGTTNSYLIERSVLSPTVTVPDSAQLTITYEISMSFAAID